MKTAPGHDEELRSSVFFERDLRATSLRGAVDAALLASVGERRGRGSYRFWTV
ncbi:MULTISPECIES: hypothetical protein [Pseudofrankia]|uniref:hypothetical protein n=1 Tax=Pseudofrankia TaxID=2994363 RepID=UPI00031399B9|nr:MULTISPECIES: hypothetical protein [Pseudofrankia]